MNPYQVENKKNITKNIEFFSHVQASKMAIGLELPTPQAQIRSAIKVDMMDHGRFNGAAPRNMAGLIKGQAGG